MRAVHKTGTPLQFLQIAPLAPSATVVGAEYMWFAALLLFLALGVCFLSRLLPRARTQQHRDTERGGSVQRPSSRPGSAGVAHIRLRANGRPRKSFALRVLFKRSERNILLRDFGFLVDALRTSQTHTLIFSRSQLRLSILHVTRTGRVLLEKDINPN